MQKRSVKVRHLPKKKSIKEVFFRYKTEFTHVKQQMKTSKTTSCHHLIVLGGHGELHHVLHQRIGIAAHVNDPRPETGGLRHLVLPGAWCPLRNWAPGQLTAAPLSKSKKRIRNTRFDLMTSHHITIIVAKNRGGISILRSKKGGSKAHFSIAPQSSQDHMMQSRPRGIDHLKGLQRKRTLGSVWETKKKVNNICLG